MYEAEKYVHPLLAGHRGGKRLLSKQIVARIPEHSCYIEPFCGGAWVLFRKKPSKTEILNDINGEIVNLYRVVKHHHEEFLKNLAWLPCSREVFEEFKAQNPAKMTDIHRACRFYFIHKNCFGGRTKDATYAATTENKKSRFNPLRVDKLINDAFSRIARVYIENLPFQEIFQRYDKEHVFFYVDPPYYGGEKDYGDFFSREDFRELADLLENVKGKFLLSINDTPEAREDFKNFNFEETETLYSCHNEKTTKNKELFITNY